MMSWMSGKAKARPAFQGLWIAAPCFERRTCTSGTHRATKGQISGLFLTSLQGERANSIHPPWKFCWVPWRCECLPGHCKRGPPLPSIYFLSQTAQNHKNQRWLLRSQPSDSENPAQGSGWQGHKSCFFAPVDPGLFTWLHSSYFLASNLVQPSDFCSRQRGDLRCIHHPSYPWT